MKGFFTQTLMICLVILMAAYSLLYYQNSRIPELGHTDGHLTALPPSPNAVSSQTENPSKQVEPLPFKNNLAETLQALLKAINHYGGVEIVLLQQDYIRVVFITPLMGFRDDAEFYLDREKRLVHFRSASRSGYSDMGLNQERYQQLATYYQSIEAKQTKSQAQN